jgi:hypothetical protein
MKKSLAYASSVLFVVALFGQGVWAQSSGGMGSGGSSSGTYGSSSGMGSSPGSGAGSSGNMSGSNSGKDSSGSMGSSGSSSGMSSGSTSGSASAGANSDNITQAQQGLQASGFDPGPIDGKLGPKTRQALKQFQQSKGQG